MVVSERDRIRAFKECVSIQDWSGAKVLGGGLRWEVWEEGVKGGEEVRLIASCAGAAWCDPRTQDTANI